MATDTGGCSCREALDQWDETLARYRRVEEQVFEEMKAMERDWIGFSFSDFEERTGSTG